jgi:hypothetical protein
MQGMMKLVEEMAGVGDLLLNGASLGNTRYRINRYQGVMEGSELPIPGLFRIEGSIASAGLPDLVGIPLGLRLEDGRLLAITLADNNGTVFSEGHGPMKCLCC